MLYDTSRTCRFNSTRQALLTAATLLLILVPLLHPRANLLAAADCYDSSMRYVDATYNQYHSWTSDDYATISTFNPIVRVTKGTLNIYIMNKANYLILQRDGITASTWSYSFGKIFLTAGNCWDVTQTVSLAGFGMVMRCMSTGGCQYYATYYFWYAATPAPPTPAPSLSIPSACSGWTYVRTLSQYYYQAYWLAGSTYSYLKPIVYVSSGTVDVYVTDGANAAAAYDSWSSSWTYHARTLGVTAGTCRSTGYSVTSTGWGLLIYCQSASGCTVYYEMVATLAIAATPTPPTPTPRPPTPAPALATPSPLSIPSACSGWAYVRTLAYDYYQVYSVSGSIYSSLQPIVYVASGTVDIYVTDRANADAASASWTSTWTWHARTLGVTAGTCRSTEYSVTSNGWGLLMDCRSTSGCTVYYGMVATLAIAATPTPPTPAPRPPTPSPLSIPSACSGWAHVRTLSQSYFQVYSLAGSTYSYLQPIVYVSSGTVDVYVTDKANADAALASWSSSWVYHGRTLSVTAGTCRSTGYSVTSSGWGLLIYCQSASGCTFYYEMLATAITAAPSAITPSPQSGRGSTTAGIPTWAFAVAVSAVSVVVIGAAVGILVFLAFRRKATAAVVAIAPVAAAASSAPSYRFLDQGVSGVVFDSAQSTVTATAACMFPTTVLVGPAVEAHLHSSVTFQIKDDGGGKMVAIGCVEEQPTLRRAHFNAGLGDASLPGSVGLLSIGACRKSHESGAEALPTPPFEVGEAITVSLNAGQLAVYSESRTHLETAFIEGSRLNRPGTESLCHYAITFTAPDQCIVVTAQQQGAAGPKRPSSGDGALRRSSSIGGGSFRFDHNPVAPLNMPQHDEPVAFQAQASYHAQPQPSTQPMCDASGLMGGAAPFPGSFGVLPANAYPGVMPAQGGSLSADPTMPLGSVPASYNPVAGLPPPLYPNSSLPYPHSAVPPMYPPQMPMPMPMGPSTSQLPAAQVSSRFSAPTDAVATSAVNPIHLFAKDFVPQQTGEEAMRAFCTAHYSPEDAERLVGSILFHADSIAAQPEIDVSRDQIVVAAWYTSDVRGLGYDEDTNWWYIVGKLLRGRKVAELKPHADALYYLQSLFDHEAAKNPPVTLWRGLHGVRMTTLSKSYQRGKVVCWPAFASTSTSQEVMQSFSGSGGGTLIKIAADRYACLSRYSMHPDEAECLLGINTLLEINQALTSEELSGFPGMEHAPTNMDLIICTQRPTPPFGILALPTITDSAHRNSVASV